MLKFHPYSILTGDTRVEFVIYCVLRRTQAKEKIDIVTNWLLQAEQIHKMATPNSQKLEDM